MKKLILCLTLAAFAAGVSVQAGEKGKTASGKATACTTEAKAACSAEKSACSSKKITAKTRSAQKGAMLLVQR